MNFASSAKGDGIELDLKYCERCGGLWLRPQGTDGVYCAVCRAHIAAMPNRGEAPRRKARRRRAGKPVADVATDIPEEELEGCFRSGYIKSASVMEVSA